MFTVNRVIQSERFSQKVQKTLTRKGFRNFKHKELKLRADLSLTADTLSIEKGRNLIEFTALSLRPDYLALLQKEKRLKSITAQLTKVDIQLESLAPTKKDKPLIAQNKPKRATPPQESKAKKSSPPTRTPPAPKVRVDSAQKAPSKNAQKDEIPYYLVDRLDLEEIQVTFSSPKNNKLKGELLAELKLDAKKKKGEFQINTISSPYFKTSSSQTIPLSYEPRILSAKNASIPLAEQSLSLNAQLGLNAFLPFQAKLKTQESADLHKTSPFPFRASFSCVKPHFIFESVGSLTRPSYTQAALHATATNVIFKAGNKGALEFSDFEGKLHYRNQRATLQSLRLYNEQYSLLGNATMTPHKGAGTFRLILSPEATPLFIKTQRGAGLGFNRRKDHTQKMKWVDRLPVPERNYRDILVRREHGKTELNLNGLNREWIDLNTVIARLTRFAIREQLEDR